MTRIERAHNRIAAELKASRPQPMPTLLEALESVKETLRMPDAWIREEYATDSRGRAVDSDDPNATSFCLMGAVARSGAGMEGWGEVTRTIQYAIDDLYHEEYFTIATFNDASEIGHGDVLKVLDWAIDAAS